MKLTLLGSAFVILVLCRSSKRHWAIPAPFVRLLVWALVLTALPSVLLGIVSLEAMPGQLAVATQLEWFHGAGADNGSDSAR